MQKLLDDAKVQMKVLTAHWRKEWRDAAAEWSEQLSIVLADGKYEYFQFPITKPGEHFFFWSDKSRQALELTLKTATGIVALLSTETIAKTGVSGSDGIYNLFHGINYYNSWAPAVFKIVPNNLAVDLFAHFVTSLSGTFYPSAYYGRVTNWLYVDDENKRHRKIIYDAIREAKVAEELKYGLPTLSASTVSVADESNDSDGWINVECKKFCLGGRLATMHYLDPLLQSLKKHQLDRMIEHQFHFYPNSKKMTELAQKIAKDLCTNDGSAGEFGSISLMNTVPYSEYSSYAHLTGTKRLLRPKMWTLLSRVYKPKRGNNRSDGCDNFWERSRERLLAFTLGDEKDTRQHWNRVIKDKFFIDTISDLSVNDMQFILHTYIEAECDYYELTEKLTCNDDNSRPLDEHKSKPAVTAAFPTCGDDFFDFDPPHLRGRLSEGVLSRKLQAHTLRLEELRKVRGKSFAAVAPAALVDIVAHYLPISL